MSVVLHHAFFSLENIWFGFHHRLLKIEQYMSIDQENQSSISPAIYDNHALGLDWSALM
jgi:hypothetical protein